jgi:hypothetical protein
MDQKAYKGKSIGHIRVGFEKNTIITDALIVDTKPEMICMKKINN